jgi:hypothetical protein
LKKNIEFIEKIHELKASMIDMDDVSQGKGELD